MNMNSADTSSITFNNVYSHPGDMESVVHEFYSLMDKVQSFLLPIKINTFEGLGWVLIELLNNAVRSPVSIAMNLGITDINEIDFFTDIILSKTINQTTLKGKVDVEISVSNRGLYSEQILKSMDSILNGELSILDCEERFMLKGSYTGNGGMGLLLSKKQVENALGGKLSLTWSEGYYKFTINFTLDEILIQ